MNPLNRARRILLFLRYGIGDLVMELPLLHALRRAAPTAQIVGVGAHPAIELLEGDGCVDALVPVHAFGLHHWGDCGAPGTEERLRGWIGSEGFDLIVDPSHAVLAFGRAAWASGLPILDLYTEAQNRALAATGSGHGALIAAARECWGIDVPDVPPRLHLSVAEREWADAQLSGLARPLAGLSPAASSTLKRWSPERIAHLAAPLRATGGTLLLFAGRDAQAADALESALQPAGALHRVGPHHLRRIAALLALCAFYVGYDTGLSHLARASGARTLVLFGPTSRRIYLSRGAVGVAAPLECGVRREDSFGPSDCLVQGHCLHAEGPCMEKLPLDNAAAALTQMLKGSGRSG